MLGAVFFFSFHLHTHTLPLSKLRFFPLKLSRSAVELFVNYMYYRYHLLFLLRLLFLPSLFVGAVTIIIVISWNYLSVSVSIGSYQPNDVCQFINHDIRYRSDNEHQLNEISKQFFFCVLPLFFFFFSCGFDFVSTLCVAKVSLLFFYFLIFMFSNSTIWCVAAAKMFSAKNKKCTLQQESKKKKKNEFKAINFVMLVIKSLFIFIYFFLFHFCNYFPTLKLIPYIYNTIQCTVDDVY